VIRKEIAGYDQDNSMVRRLYLANVEAFVDPICVIPDIGSPDFVRYFEVLPRREWQTPFIKWVMAPIQEELDELKEEEGVTEYKIEVDYKAKGQAQRAKAAAKKKALKEVDSQHATKKVKRGKNKQKVACKEGTKTTGLYGTP
jgi:hypothetical protein